MDDAQGEHIDAAVGAQALAREFAALADVNTENAVKALQAARDRQNLRADSAFGTRFCEVDDASELNFDAAAAYIESHDDGWLESERYDELAVAVAAEGLGGMGGERAIINHFDWLQDAGDDWEDDGVDAFTDDGIKVQIKRNDRTAKRHSAWGLDDDTILLSWKVCDDGGIAVGFEGPNDDKHGRP